MNVTNDETLEFKNTKISAGTIARTVCLVIALLNQLFNILGMTVLDFNENDIYTFVSIGFTIVTSVIAWWKNNSVTKPALQGDVLMEKLKDLAKM